MKKIVLLVVLMMLVSCVAFANSGGTDAWGGHTPSNGSGYHQHTPPETYNPAPNPNNPYNTYNPSPRK